MPKVKFDLASIAAQERELRDKLRELKKQQRALARAEQDARLRRVAELADQFGITHLSDTLLAAEFKRLAAAHPPATEPADTTGTVAGDREEARTPASEPAAAGASPGSEAETAQSSSESGGESDSKKRRFGWGS